MSVTIYDVAKKARIGVSTVSRALNNKSDVSPETKKRILQIANELNYQPHAVAQALARQKTQCIAAIVPFFTSDFFVATLKGIQQELTIHNYDLILYSVDALGKTDYFLERTLQDKKVDGALLVSLPIRATLVNKFKKAELPIVLIDSYYEGLDSHTIQNMEGAFLATSYLLDLGHTNIGIINGELSSPPATARLKGFRNALKQRNITYKRQFVFICESQPHSGFTEEAGYWAMKRMFQLNKNLPTALFVASDLQAIGAIRAIQEAGLQVPDDISIVGFDDIAPAKYLGLTTIKQPMFEVGQFGIKRLIEKINNQDSEILHQTFKTELIIRKTCRKI